MDFYLIAGLTAGFELNTDSKNVVVIEEPSEFAFKEDLSYNDVLLGGMLGFGISFAVTENIELSIEPSFGFYFSDVLGERWTNPNYFKVPLIISYDL